MRQALEEEITALAGGSPKRAECQPAVVRWSRRKGSVSPADQKLPLRNTREGSVQLILLPIQTVSSTPSCASSSS